MKKLTVLRWDLDKTYLVSEFESLRGLLRIPFERATDKRAIPGVVELIRALRSAAEVRDRRVSVRFLSSSPPQIGSTIREKLRIDGIEYDEIRFKNQIHHLMRWRFDVLREQIGYKLSELLRAAEVTDSGAEELLFGDDWESDPFIYSLYADVIAGRVERDRLRALLDQAGVHADYLEAIFETLGRGLRPRRIRSICILRARPRSDEELAAFGSRLLWFDNYFEAALLLHALGHLASHGVIAVARQCELDPRRLTEAFEATVRRGCGVRREHLTVARRALLHAGLLSPVAAGRLLLRAAVRVRALLGRPPVSDGKAGPMPDYESLVGAWSRRGRKEAAVERVGQPAAAGARDPMAAAAGLRAGDDDDDESDG